MRHSDHAFAIELFTEVGNISGRAMIEGARFCLLIFRLAFCVFSVFEDFDFEQREQSVPLGNTARDSCERVSHISISICKQVDDETKTNCAIEQRLD